MTKTEYTNKTNPFVVSCNKIKSQLQFKIIHLILNLPLNRKIKLHLHIIPKWENRVEMNFSRFNHYCIKQILYHYFLLVHEKADFQTLFFIFNKSQHVQSIYPSPVILN